MSLVYSTLFALVPVVAVAFAVLKAFGCHHQIEPLLLEFLRPLGEQGQSITSSIMGFVENVQGTLLGTVGFVFLLFTAVSTVQKVEEALNFTWHVDRPRSYARRATEYLVVLLVVPALAVAAMSLLASFEANEVVAKLSGLAAGRSSTGPRTHYILILGLFGFLYVYMPNTRVRFWPAVIGTLFGGFLWAFVGALFARIVVYSAQLAAMLRRPRGRTTVPVLAVPELADPAARRAAVFLRAAPRAPEDRARGHPDDRRTARAPGDGGDVPAGPAVRGRCRALVHQCAGRTTRCPCDRARQRGVRARGARAGAHRRRRFAAPGPGPGVQSRLPGYSTRSGTRCRTRGDRIRTRSRRPTQWRNRRTKPCAPVSATGRFSTWCAATPDGRRTQSPAIVISPTRIEPVRMPPRTSTSSPTETMPR